MDQKAFISIWGTKKHFADSIGEGETTVRNWFIRFNIPHRYDAKIIAAAANEGRKVTHQDMFRLRENLFTEKRRKERKAKREASAMQGVEQQNVQIEGAQP